MNLNQVLWPRGCRPLQQADQVEDRRTDKEGEEAAARGETFSHFQLWKGLFTNFFLLFKSHILDSNGVWYSWFWPEGSINAQNSQFLGFHFVPRDLNSRRHRFESRSHGAASRGPLRRESRSPVPRVEVPCGAASWGPWGQNENPKMLSFGRL